MIHGGDNLTRPFARCPDWSFQLCIAASRRTALGIAAF